MVTFSTLDFDLFFRDFFRESSIFLPQTSAKLNYPVDIYRDGEKLVFEIACTGINKEEINIKIQGDNLRVIYDRAEKEEDSREYINKGIAKRSFDLGWKIPSTCDSGEAKATFKNGLLSIEFPLRKEAKPKTLTID